LISIRCERVGAEIMKITSRTSITSTAA
jgi:hypothetical protein